MNQKDSNEKNVEDERNKEIGQVSGTDDSSVTMMKATSKPDYGKMSEGELRILLAKHQQMLNNTRLINALPDKGARFRDAINEIERLLAGPSSPMDCDVISNQFSQMTFSSNENELSQPSVHLEGSGNSFAKAQSEADFSEQRLNEVKQRLKARQAERDSNKTTVTKPKIISLDEAVRLYREEKEQAEEYLIQQTTSRLLGNMSLSKTTFGLPPTTSSKTNLTYRKTTHESDEDIDNQTDELGREKAEIQSDHESDEADYPDHELENDDD